MDPVVLVERQSLCTKILKKYPKSVPIIVNKGNNSDPDISCHKFIVPKSSSFGHLIKRIRSNISGLTKDQTIFFFINEHILIPNGDHIECLYNKHKHDDGFLYITYAVENTFGYTSVAINIPL